MPPPIGIQVPVMCALLVTSADQHKAQASRPGLSQHASEAEHVIERKATRIIHQSVIAEQTAGDIPYQNVTVDTGSSQRGRTEYRVWPYHDRSGAGDLHRLGGDFVAGAVMQAKLGRRPPMPGGGSRIDQHRETAPCKKAQFKKQGGGETGRRTGIGLRLIAISHRGIEDMRPEAGLGDVAGLPVLVTKQRVQPAIRLAAFAKIVDQLRMTGGNVLDLRRDSMIALKTTEK